MFSFWEYNSWLNNIDVAVIGSGISGLSTAIHLKKTNPKLNVVVLEKGILPSGASTKNAGFACFGSLGELNEDLQNNSIENTLELLKSRVKGLNLLRELLGDKNIDYYNWSGFELFRDVNQFEKIQNKISFWNSILEPIFQDKNTFEVSDNVFGFNKIKGIIKNKFESQIDTGKMMKSYLLLASKLGVQVFNGAEVELLNDNLNHVVIQIKNNKEIKVKKAVICSNGFAKLLINVDVLPARAQVLITKPIKKLSLKGTFHYDKGYYYFRNIENRVLLGGGRNLCIEEETTTKFETTKIIQDSLEQILKEVILPTTNFEIDKKWVGIMGVGKNKSPIIKKYSKNIVVGVRLGGMGVALGTSVGKECSDLIIEDL